MNRIRITLFLWLTVGVGIVTNAQTLLMDDFSGLKYIERKGDEGKPIIIMIHGYGTNEKDLFSFAKYFPGTTFLSLRAPYKRANNSYSWYEITFNPDGSRDRNLEQAISSINTLVVFLENLKKSSGKQIIVGGFSQGAILSVKLAISYPHLIDGMIGFSGMLLDDRMNNKYALTPQGKEQYSNLTAFYGHGIQDPLLSIEQGRNCAALLKACGIPTVYKEYNMTHQISSQELEDVIAWYNDNFGQK